jgi:hypothetical protein
MFFKQYDAIARTSYDLINCWVRRNSFTQYLSYGFNMGKVYFPKISYQNPYEPEYTKASVKYSWVVVSGLIGFTLYATKSKINSYYAQ